jgi:hypothetical protein
MCGYPASHKYCSNKEQGANNKVTKTYGVRQPAMAYPQSLIAKKIKIRLLTNNTAPSQSISIPGCGGFRRILCGTKARPAIKAKNRRIAPIQTFQRQEGIDPPDLISRF